jgi:hypothetical protein
VKENWHGGMEYCTFSPKINESSSAGKRAKNRNSLDRSVQLYLNAFEIQERKLAKQLESNDNFAPKLASRSIQIVTQAKINAFIKIFSRLDSDQDNQISLDHINLESLPLQTLRILKPIFSELEDMAESISREEFIDACERLYYVSAQSFILISCC